MELIVVLQAVAALLKVAEGLGMDEVSDWRDALEEIQETTEPAIEAAEELLEMMTRRVNGVIARKRLHEAAKKNPAMRRPEGRRGFADARTVIAVVSLLVALTLAVLVIGCGGRVSYISPTEDVVEGYGVEWPADASRDPADYHTVLEDGVMVTTVPIVRMNAEAALGAPSNEGLR